MSLRGLSRVVREEAGPVVLTVELTRPGTSRGGFQLSARYAEGPEAGRQAGRFRVDGRTAAVTREAGVAYVHHTPEGTRSATADTLRWEIRWMPPERPAAPVVFHVAANAANDDASELGDRIYTDRATVGVGEEDVER